MLVVIAKDLPPAVRGRLKLFCIELKSGVFVSGLKKSLAQKLIDYLLLHCPNKTGLMILSSKNSAPGFSIIGKGESIQDLVELSGFQMVRIPPKKSNSTPS